MFKKKLNIDMYIYIYIYKNLSQNLQHRSKSYLALDIF